MQAGPGTTSLRLRVALCLCWFLTTYPGKRRVMSRMYATLVWVTTSLIPPRWPDEPWFAYYLLN